MDKKCQILLVVILLSTPLIGCFDKDQPITLIWHDLLILNGSVGEYMYFPMVVDNHNNTIIGKDCYSYRDICNQRLEGTNDYVTINGTKFLNISMVSSQFEVRAKITNLTIDFDLINIQCFNINVTEYQNFDEQHYGVYGEDFKVSKVYYSGTNDPGIFSDLKTYESDYYISKNIVMEGIFYQGWNEVIVMLK